VGRAKIQRGGLENQQPAWMTTAGDRNARKGVWERSGQNVGLRSGPPTNPQAARRAAMKAKRGGARAGLGQSQQRRHPPNKGRPGPGQGRAAARPPGWRPHSDTPHNATAILAERWRHQGPAAGPPSMDARPPGLGGGVCGPKQKRAAARPGQGGPGGNSGSDRFKTHQLGRGALLRLNHHKPLFGVPGGTQDAAREERFTALPTREQGTTEAGRMPAEGCGCQDRGGTTKGGPCGSGNNRRSINFFGQKNFGQCVGHLPFNPHGRLQSGRRRVAARLSAGGGPDGGGRRPPGTQPLGAVKLGSLGGVVKQLLVLLRSAAGFAQSSISRSREGR